MARLGEAGALPFKAFIVVDEGPAPGELRGRPSGGDTVAVGMGGLRGVNGYGRDIDGVAWNEMVCSGAAKVNFGEVADEGSSTSPLSMLPDAGLRENVEEVGNDSGDSGVSEGAAVWSGRRAGEDAELETDFP